MHGGGGDAAGGLNEHAGSLNLSPTLSHRVSSASNDASPVYVQPLHTVDGLHLCVFTSRMRTASPSP